jgi:O-antigen/teichoic acid export membrane protein
LARSISPTAWVTVQNLFTQICGVAIFAVQAPLLGPKAFGLVALVMVFIGFFESVLEVAATDALLSVRAIDRIHYATSTTTTLVCFSLFGAAFFIFAHPLAVALKEPELASIFQVMSVIPTFAALISAPSAATRRDLKFGPLAARTMASTLIGGIVGLTLALLHYGVWALVWQAIVQRVLSAAMLWAFVPLRFSLGFSRTHFRELMGYAAPMVLSQSMAWGTAQFPRFILGVFLGADELGIFSLATRLNEVVLLLTLSPRYGVARVEMTKYGDDLANLRIALKRLLAQMGFLCFPVCIGGAAIMPTLFAVWLDSRWTGGVYAAQFVMLGSIAFVTHYGLSAALLGMNKQFVIALNATVQMIITAIVMSVFAPFGLNVATGAFALRTFAAAPVPAWYARQFAGISFTEIAGAQAHVFLAAATMGLGVMLLRVLLMPYVAQGYLLMILVLAGAVLYAVLVAWLQPDVAAQITQRFKRKKAADLANRV